LFYLKKHALQFFNMYMKKKRYDFFAIAFFVNVSFSIISNQRKTFNNFYVFNMATVILCLSLRVLPLSSTSLLLPYLRTDIKSPSSNCVAGLSTYVWLIFTLFA